MTTFTEDELARILSANPDVHLDNRGESAPSPRRMASRQAAGHLSEHELQKAVFEQCAIYARNDPRFDLIFAIPNGGYRNKAAAGRMKAEGQKAGVPDIFIAVPNHKKGFAGMFLELKVGRNRQTPHQVSWANALSRQGYFTACVWDSVDDAMDLIVWYFSDYASDLEKPNAVEAFDALRREYGHYFD